MPEQGLPAYALRCSGSLAWRLLGQLPKAPTPNSEARPRVSRAGGKRAAHNVTMLDSTGLLLGRSISVGPLCHGNTLGGIGRPGPCNMYFLVFALGVRRGS